MLKKIYVYICFYTYLFTYLLFTLRWKLSKPKYTFKLFDMLPSLRQLFYFLNLFSSLFDMILNLHSTIRFRIRNHNYSKKVWLYISISYKSHILIKKSKNIIIKFIMINMENSLRINFLKIILIFSPFKSKIFPNSSKDKILMHSETVKMFVVKFI